MASDPRLEWMNQLKYQGRRTFLAQENKRGKDWEESIFDWNGETWKENDGRMDHSDDQSPAL